MNITKDLKKLVSKEEDINLKNKKTDTTLTKRNNFFLEYLSASWPPIGAVSKTVIVGLAATRPTIVVELVFSKTHQFIR